MKRETMLFLFEPSSIDAFLNGKSTPVYSHDLNLMQLAQSALNLGARVYIANFHDSGKLYGVKSMWPTIDLDSQFTFDSVLRQLTFTFSANHIAFLTRNRNRNRNRNVLVQAAIHPIEDPSMFYPAGISSYINIVRNHIDFFVTQNSRMKDLLIKLLGLLAGFQESHRILISKLVPKQSLKVNKKMNRDEFRKLHSIESSEILIVNAGGAWSWTLFHEFIQAFAKVVTDFPDIKFFFFQPALGQPTNFAHSQYNKKTLEILSGLSGVQKSRILIGDNWDSDGILMTKMLDAADYGISFSKESLEHWQSHRVRILEYLTHAVPVVTSTGSFWDDEDAGEGFIFVGHRESDLYNAISKLVQTHTPELKMRREKDLENLLENLTLPKQGESLIRQLVEHPLRYQKTLINSAPIWDFRDFGEPRKIGIRRIYRRIYYRMLNNVYIHSLLVILGVRRFVRFLRKIR